MIYFLNFLVNYKKIKFLIKMVVNKRKKFSRQRGSWTHGWGAKKKHRGAGHRGGKGMAGSGKRADSKKPSLWKERYFGKLGFKKKGIKREIKSINISYLEEHLDELLSKKLISKEDNFYVIDILKLGYNKLLGDGKVNNKLKVKTKYASKNSINKIKNSGGEVILVSEKTEG